MWGLFHYTLFMASYFQTSTPLNYISDGSTPVIIWAVLNHQLGSQTCSLEDWTSSTTLATSVATPPAGSFMQYTIMWYGTLPSGERMIQALCPTGHNNHRILLQEQLSTGGGSGTSSFSGIANSMNGTTTCTTIGSDFVCVSEGYNFDVSVSLMLGGLLAFFVAYWLVGLVRRSKTL